MRATHLDHNDDDDDEEEQEEEEAGSARRTSEEESDLQRFAVDLPTSLTTVSSSTSLSHTVAARAPARPKSTSNFADDEQEALPPARASLVRERSAKNTEDELSRLAATAPAKPSTAKAPPSFSASRRDGSPASAAASVTPPPAKEALSFVPRWWNRRMLAPALISLAFLLVLASLSALQLHNQSTYQARLASQELKLRAIEVRFGIDGAPAEPGGDLNVFDYANRRARGEEQPVGAARTLHTGAYEFVLPEQPARAGESIRVPARAGESIPGLDLKQTIRYDVCCWLGDGTLNCARGTDVSRATPSMSAALVEDPSDGSQYLSLRFSSGTAYAARRCALTFDHRV